MYVLFDLFYKYDVDKILSLRHCNNISNIYEAFDTSKNIKVIMDISSKEKYYNRNIFANEEISYLKYYDEIFDYKLGDNVYTCAILKVQFPSLSEFIKDRVDKIVFFFSFFFYLMYLESCGNIC
jgi:hypothetical protein